MNINDFCAACAWLTGDDVDVTEARYDRQAFGSWYIEVAHKGKRRRAIWDGRDGWLILESRQADDAWTDEWIGRQADEQTVEEVVRRLRD